MFEMRPISFGATSRGIIESLKTMENSAAIDASEKNTSGNIRPEPGAANHSMISDRILMMAKKPIHGLRRPVWSAIEPSTGESTAMIRPETAMP